MLGQAQSNSAIVVGLVRSSKFKIDRQTIAWSA